MGGELYDDWYIQVYRWVYQRIGHTVTSLLKDSEPF
jgi:hypothetical protein